METVSNFILLVIEASISHLNLHFTLLGRRFDEGDATGVVPHRGFLFAWMMSGFVTGQQHGFFLVLIRLNNRIKTKKTHDF